MTPSPAESETTIHRLHPLRVLVSGRDRRFVRVTSFLLSQRGYDVAQTSPRKTLETVQQHRSDVVLLETSNVRVVVARQVAALQALPVAPSVLVAFEGDDDSSWQGLSTVKKWMPIETLVEQIEAAALARPAQLTESERAYL
jgi:CheY-like chemotaxis protein